MKKAILALFITVTFVATFNFKGSSLTANPTLSHGLFEFVDTSCGGAVDGFNKGVKQLIKNIQTQSNQWLVYSDLDALDGFAYHLENLCEPTAFQLTAQLGDGQTPEQQQACSNLFAMVGSILDQNQPQTFKGGYEQGLAWSQQALTLGPNITSGCKIWVEVNVEVLMEESAAEEEWGWDQENNEVSDQKSSDDDDSDDAGKSSDDSDAMLDWNLSIFTQKKSHEDCDSDDAQNDSDDSEEDSDNDNDNDNSDDQDSDDDSEDDSDEDSDDCNEEEWAGEEWNNEEWTTKAWASEEGIMKAWDSEEWATQAWENEEWSLKPWDSGDSSDWQAPNSDSSDDHGHSTFFSQVNPDGNTDSGSDWMNGDYQKYIPPGSGGNPESPGGNGGPKTKTFLAFKQEKDDSDASDDSGNQWMSGDYKRYYEGNNENSGPQQALVYLVI